MFIRLATSLRWGLNLFHLRSLKYQPGANMVVWSRFLTTTNLFLSLTNFSLKITLWQVFQLIPKSVWIFTESVSCHSRVCSSHTRVCLSPKRVCLFLPESVWLVRVIWCVQDSKLSVAQYGDQNAIGIGVIVVGRLFKNALLQGKQILLLKTLFKITAKPLKIKRQNEFCMGSGKVKKNSSEKNQFLVFWEYFACKSASIKFGQPYIVNGKEYYNLVFKYS